jgi:hypothetical protein
MVINKSKSSKFCDDSLLMDAITGNDQMTLTLPPEFPKNFTWTRRFLKVPGSAT